jgi:CRP/FNR family transcriptional regulator, anaerobic regulatory protein
MDYSHLLKNIAKHIQLEKRESDYFISILVVKKVRRNEFVLEEGELCTAINYVQNGALRAYYRDGEGNQNIIMFALPDWWVTDMYGFVSGKPAMLNIDALEDSEIVQLRKEDLEKLYLKVPKFERFFRIIMQNAYIREQLRVIGNLSKPAEERYKSFLAKYPQVAERVPLKQIASYLGITPEFLSVIRKNIKDA